MHHYPHHISDFNNATRHLTRIERSVYRDLIELYYDSENPLPADVQIICRKIIALSQDEVTAVEQVLNEYFVLTEKGYENNRCNQVIKDYKRNAKNKSLAGKASAQARKSKKSIEKEPLTDVQQVLNTCSTDVRNHKPETRNQEPVKKNTSKYFDDFWKVYPKKVDKKKTLIIWKRRNLDDITEMILTDVQNRIANDGKWADGYIPNPTTYLNGDRWEDELQQRGQLIEKNRGIQRFDADTYIIGQIEAEYE